MQQRFRRGAISIGPGKCDSCGRTIKHGEVYLCLDEKPSDKLKEETVFIDDVECSECGNKIEDAQAYLFVLDADEEKCYCPPCYKKKGGESFRKKNLGVEIQYRKSPEVSTDLSFCGDCCDKRKAGLEKKEKGEKIFTLFPSKTGK
jgi:hypothetical protein